MHTFSRGQKIQGYVHGFFNQKVRENQNFFSFLAHNIFGFDFHRILRGIRLHVWKSKDLQVGGSNLTNINFPSLNS